MSVSQISVFTESKPGHLSKILANFNDAEVSVKGYSVSDTGDYGIARFIVDDIDRATDALESRRYAFTISEVLCMKLQDNPGELARVFKTLSERDINVKYSYSMISTYIVLSASDIQEAKEVLHEAGIDTIAQKDIASIGVGA